MEEGRRGQIGGGGEEGGNDGGRVNGWREEEQNSQEGTKIRKVRSKEG